MPLPNQVNAKLPALELAAEVDVLEFTELEFAALEFTEPELTALELTALDTTELAASELAKLCVAEEFARLDATEFARLLALVVAATLDELTGADDAAGVDEPEPPPPQAVMMTLVRLRAKTIFLLISDLSRVYLLCRSADIFLPDELWFSM